MTTQTTRILTLSDAGWTPAQIAVDIGRSVGTVYAALREHRPSRRRAPRARTSEKRARIIGLLASGITAPRVAFLTDVSDAYVYRIAAETRCG